jgi:hypothetical protein
MTHFPLLDLHIVYPKLEPDTCLFRFLSTAAQQVQAQHHWIVKAFALWTFPETDRHVPFCLKSIDIKIKCGAVKGVLFVAGVMVFLDEPCVFENYI